MRSSPHHICAFRTSLLAAIALMFAFGCAPPEEDSGVITLKYWDLNPGPNRTPFNKKVVADFEAENPDIKVQYIETPYSASRMKLITSTIAGHDQPDVTAMFGAWAAEFAKMDALEDLTPYFESWEDKDTIDPIAVKMAKEAGGSLFYMPMRLGADALYYRKDWFDEAGLEPPKDWDELLTVAKHFTDRKNNRYGFAIRGGMGGDTYVHYFMMSALGKPMFDENGICQLNQPEAVEGLQFYLDLHRKHKITQPSGVTAGYRELVSSFSSGTVAMYIHNNGSIGDQIAKVGADNFMTAPMPVGPRARTSTLATNGIAIHANSEKKEAAWRLVKHFARQDMQSYWCQKTGAYPTNLLTREEPWCKNDPYLKAFFYEGASEALDASAPDFLDDYSMISVDTIVPEVQKALMGDQTAQETADKIAADLTESYGRWMAKFKSE